MADCHQCGAPLKANKPFCTRCGAKVEKRAAAPHASSQAVAATVPCSNCGAVVPTSKRFCPQCGRRSNPPAQTPTSPSTSPTAWSNPSTQRQAAAGVKCDKCGASVPAGKRFCTACGNRIETKPAPGFLAPPYPPHPPVIETLSPDVQPVEAKPDKPFVAKPPDIKTAPPRRAWLRVALPVAGLVAIIAAAFAVYLLFIRKPGPLGDKQLLESYYGPPPFFTVVLAKDDSQPSPKIVRREVWVYPERKVSFVFLGGTYQFSSDLQSISKNVSQAASRLRIEQITESLTVDELTKLVGSKPVSQVNLPKEELADAIRYDYGNGINAVFNQGRLLMLRTLPATEK